VPLFLIASRFVNTLSRRSVAALLGFAISMLVLGAAAFSLTQHMSFGLALIVMLTTIPAVGAVFAIWTSSAVIKHIRRLFGMDRALPTQSFTIVYGADSTVGHALDELAATGDPVVLVALEKPADLDESIQFIAGDPSDEKVIATSHPERANRALIAAGTDADTLVTAVALHTLAPQLETFALTRSPHVARALIELGVSHTLSADDLVGHTLAKSLETPQAADLLLQLVDTENYQLRQSPVPADLATQRLSAIRAARPGALVLGISRGDQVDLGLSDDPVLQAGDSLIVLEPESAGSSV
jgi:voltage-gated potassium channel